MPSRYLGKLALLVTLLVATAAIHISSGHTDKHSRQYPTFDEPQPSKLSSSNVPTQQTSSPAVTSQTQSGRPQSQNYNEKPDSSSGSSLANSRASSNAAGSAAQPETQKPAEGASVPTQQYTPVKADAQFAKNTTLKKKGNIFYGTRKATGQQIPIEVVGEDDTSFFPKKVDVYEPESQEYDVIVVGSGLSGMTASLYLVDNKKKVLVLEKEDHFGGLAAYRKDQRGYAYDRGASYWTKAYNEEFQIMNHLRISKYFHNYIIPEPIDTYFWNGVLYGGYPHDGVWDDRTLGLEVPAKYPNGTSLPYLPSSFAIFKLECKNEDASGRIPDQPFEQWKNFQLDVMNTNQWVRQMPQRLHQRISKPGLFARERRLWARFQQQIEKGILNKDDPMIDVINFLNLYARSALGSVNEDLSAMGYANFYVSELQPRFTTPFGTNIAIKEMLENVKTKPQYATLKKSSIVVEISNTDTGVEVKYIENGKGKSVKAKLAIYACQLSFAPNIVKDLDTQSPLQAKTMRELKMAHYSVHNAEITNHPYREAYDTWVRASDWNMLDFTDMILGRWVELKGYKRNPHDEVREMLWDYSKNPDNRGSVISLYNSLMKINPTAVDETNQKYGDYYSAWRAEYAWNRFEDIFSRSNKLRQDFKVTKIVTNRWPYSIHIPEPGHFSVKSRILGKTFGNIFFGNNNLGTPSFEEALFRGHCAANKALYRLDPKGFKQESWSKCEFKA